MMQTGLPAQSKINRVRLELADGTGYLTLASGGYLILGQGSSLNGRLTGQAASGPTGGTVKS